MAKELKQIIHREMDRSFGKVDSCILVDYRGLNSEQTQDLRSLLSKGGVELTVVQNRIAKRVFGGRGAPEDFQVLFRGPTAVLHGTDGALTASKTLVQWKKKNKDLAPIKGGLFQGKTMSPKEVENLATLPDAATLRGSIAGLFLSPLSHLSTCIQGLLSHFASASKAHKDTLEKGGGS